jgi:hypothetical protein
MRGLSPEEGSRKGPAAVKPCAEVMGLPRQWNEEDRFWFLRLVRDINQHDRADRADHAERSRPPQRRPPRPVGRPRGRVPARGAREARRGGR